MTTSSPRFHSIGRALRCLTALLATFPGVGAAPARGASALMYIWPVSHPVVIQVYGCRSCYVSRSGWYNAGISTHSGVDIQQAGAAADDFFVPIVAAADGVVERLIPFGEETGGAGNSVILRHADGRFTFYFHLDSFDPGLAPGTFVAQGAPLGRMGSSGLGARGATVIHLHFEIRDTPVMGRIERRQFFMGYTPGHPDLYGYEDPRGLVEGIAADPVSSTLVRVLSPGLSPVRSSPGEIYEGATPAAITEKIESGQRYVALRRARVEGRDWYFIDLPSHNAPMRKSHYPNNGPTGGWVDGDTVSLENPASDLEVVEDEGMVRRAPWHRSAPLASVHRGQHLIPAGAPVARHNHGCATGWYPVSIPPSAGASTGWICADSLVERSPASP